MGLVTRPYTDWGLDTTNPTLNEPVQKPKQATKKKGSCAKTSTVTSDWNQRGGSAIRKSPT